MAESDIGAHEDRRKFLATCGKFAVVTPPAITLLLSTSLTSDAIAASGAGRFSDGGRSNDGLFGGSSERRSNDGGSGRGGGGGSGGDGSEGGRSKGATFEGGGSEGGAGGRSDGGGSDDDGRKSSKLRLSTKGK
jgi:hypothetical protein